MSIFLTVALMPVSLLYSLLMQLRVLMYSVGIVTRKKLPRPVISVGNVTVGGTGKTPVTAYIARLLLSQGLKVTILSRGYGGSLEGQTVVVSDGTTVMLRATECGDEPFLLAATTPGLSVVIGPDRYAAGLVAMKQLAPDVFILDDGYQHIQLHRDLDILLLDATRPFGNGWTLPAGLLREPRSACARADLIIHTRCPEGITAAGIIAQRPFCTARHRLTGILSLTGGEMLPFDSLHGTHVLAFSGIADPQFFFDGLRAHGLNPVATLSLPDHVQYDDSLIDEIKKAMLTTGANYALTTEKDGVKLQHLPVGLAEKTLLARLELTIDDPTPLNTLLRNLLQK
jgi:tetraacyldisaccharide 4'-kinase